MRPASNEELRILQRLLSIVFPGAIEYRAQLNGLMVEPDDSVQGQLEFIIQDSCPSATLPKSPLIIEGQFTDTDGILVDMFLFAHTGNGRLYLLDYQKHVPDVPIINIFPPNQSITIKLPAPAIALPE